MHSLKFYLFWKLNLLKCYLQTKGKYLFTLVNSMEIHVVTNENLLQQKRFNSKGIKISAFVFYHKSMLLSTFLIGITCHASNEFYSKFFKMQAAGQRKTERLDDGQYKYICCLCQNHPKKQPI